MSYQDYLNGLNDGFNIGFSAGLRTGFFAGVRKGFELGRSSGYLSGYQDGYKDASCGLPYTPINRLDRFKPIDPLLEYDDPAIPNYRLPKIDPMPEPVPPLPNLMDDLMMAEVERSSKYKDPEIPGYGLSKFNPMPDPVLPQPDFYSMKYKKPWERW